MNRLLIIPIVILLCFGCSKSSNKIDPENTDVSKPEVSVKLDGKTVYSGDHLFTIGNKENSKILVNLICIKYSNELSSDNYRFYTDLSDGGQLGVSLLLNYGVQKGVYDISYLSKFSETYDLSGYINQFPKTCLVIVGNSGKENKAWTDVQGSCTVTAINYYEKETQIANETYISKNPLLDGSFKIKVKSADNKSHTLTGSFKNVLGMGDFELKN